MGFNEWWRYELYNIVSADAGLQDMNLNKLKLNINESYKKDDKITRNYEPSNDEDVVKNAWRDTKLSTINENGQRRIPFIEKEVSEFLINFHKSARFNDPQTLIQNTVKKTR